MKTQGKSIVRLTSLAVAIVLLSAVANPSTTRADTGGATVWGTWYVTFDAAGGASIPAVVTLHRDGTWTSSDASDFGGPPFQFRDSPIRGVWARTGAGTFAATGMFLGADPVLGVLSHIARTRIPFRFGSDSDHINGEVFQDVFSCPTPFTCPDPFTTEPDATLPPVPFRGRRLRVGL